MVSIRIEPYIHYNDAEISLLYRSVGWTSYLRREGLLKEAYAGSLMTLAAYDGDRLCGIVRGVGDGVSVLYIQDLLVLPEYQRRGIGSKLLEQMLGAFPDVNQTVLLADDTVAAAAFYEKAGFRKVNEVGCCSFIRLHACYS
ncbi:MAG: GNAT family N-acetyltransferase [Clostridia bacterium]|nr:GNAT family N-acetyltransferase [Clostridia bacterium]